MEFSIRPTTGVPIYVQLAEQIRAGVARGRLKPDHRLPSVRELSQTLVVNPNTVARAYTELERDGVLYTRPGLGVFVNQLPPPLPKKTRRERLSVPVEQLLIDAVRLGASVEEVQELIEQRAAEFQWPVADAASK
jgi:GntR family transcriptional regulator